MRVLFNVAGHIGNRFFNGAFIRTDAGTFFAHKVGTNHDSATWAELDLPTEYRSQTDVNGTAAMLGARVTGGAVSANVIGGKSSIGWKAERGTWSLADLEAMGKLSHKDIVAICSYYEIEDLAAAA